MEIPSPHPNLLADLEALLGAHRPADEDEAHFLAQMKDAIGSSRGCWHRDHMQPGHFTNSAFVLHPDGGQILLIHHAKLRRWLQPGGHLESTDPSALAGARREALEEVGISALRPLGSGLFDVDVHAIPENPKKGEPRHLHLDLRFLFVSPTQKLMPDSDALDARWVDFDQVSEVESDASVMRAIRKIKALDRRGALL
jgi:8-oxo-dGTP pyrophosphatase MutT (NUDIX family)